MGNGHCLCCKFIRIMESLNWNLVVFIPVDEYKMPAL